MSTEDRLPAWANLHRNLAAVAAVDDARPTPPAIAGSPWSPVTWSPRRMPSGRAHALHAQIEAGVAAADYTGHERILGRNDRTTWCWRPTPEVAAAELVRAARTAAERLDPGWWQVEANDY